MKNPDTRVQFTRNALKQALLTLMEEKNVDKITVKELCETAGINRGTFYLHYDSPSALLADIENQFLEENLAIFRSYWKTQRDRNLMTELFLCIRKSGDFAAFSWDLPEIPRFSAACRTSSATVSWTNGKKNSRHMS